MDIFVIVLLLCFAIIEFSAGAGFGIKLMFFPEDKNERHSRNLWLGYYLFAAIWTIGIMIWVCLTI